MKVAKSYQNYNFDLTKAYKNDKGNLVVDALCKCDRCVKGVYVSRIENGKPVPHPAYGGVCLKCGGSGYLKKTIRVYSDEEYEKMERRNKQNQERKRAEQEQKMKEEFAANKAKWLEEYGCNENSTFVYYLADSYERKDELKAAGFVFDQNLLWHCAAPSAEYASSVIEIKLADIIDFSAWGQGHYKENAQALVKNAIKQARPHSTSHYVGEVGKRLTDLRVKLVSIFGFNGAYGFSQVVKFVDAEGNIFKWFTASNIKFELNSTLLLAGTVKEQKLDKYEDDAEVTILTRCKLKEAN
jgi:hypothetical protein